jgi:hypothetical protein
MTTTDREMPQRPLNPRPADQEAGGATADQPTVVERERLATVETTIQRHAQALAALPPDEQPARCVGVVAAASANAAPSPESLADVGDAGSFEAFNAAVREQVIDGLHELYRRFAKLAGYDAGTKRFRARWAQGYSPLGTLGALKSFANAFEDGLPAELRDQYPGFHTRLQVKLRQALKRNRR